MEALILRIKFDTVRDFWHSLIADVIVFAHRLVD